MSRKHFFLLLLLSFFPLLLGIAAGLVINQWFDNSLSTIVISRSSFSLLAGLELSLLLFVGFFVFIRQKHLSSQSLAQLEVEFEADRLKFFQRLDHELKNPLTAIRLGLLNISSNSIEERDKSRSSIEGQVDRMVRLTTDIGKLVELDQVKLDYETFDLTEFLTELVDLAVDAHDRAIDLSLPKAPWPLPEISADRGLLFLALINLLENAIKFTESDDDIEIRARESQQSVIIEVADTGPGVDSDDFDLVWDHLYRGARTRSLSGSGLGLPLVKAVIERHGGSVALVSRAGAGSVFSVTLPV